MWGVFSARVKFVLCGLADIYLTHYMVSTTIRGVPTEEGCVFGELIAYSRVLWEAEMDELY